MDTSALLVSPCANLCKPDTKQGLRDDELRGNEGPGGERRGDEDGDPLGQESSSPAGCWEPRGQPRENSLPPKTLSCACAEAETQALKTSVPTRTQHPCPSLLSPPSEIFRAVALPSPCSCGLGAQMLTPSGQQRLHNPAPSAHLADEETEAQRQNVFPSSARGNSSLYRGSQGGTRTIHDYFCLTPSPLQPVVSF